MSPRSLSRIVPAGNDMKKLLIVVCVVYTLPNQKQLDFRVRSPENKTKAAGERDGC
jgi:hypothetical protein